MVSGVGGSAVTGPPVTVLTWLAAVLPVALLFVLVASGRVRSQAAAAIVLGVTVVVAVTTFRSGAANVGVGLVKGLWLGLWILFVVWPALLLYRIASAAGLDRIGESFSTLLPGRSERLLVLAWVFPAFIQGVAGFGTPIAVSAPLLAAMGWSRTRAVAYPLVGYHWAVTFGSMGSSYYMASLTAQLGLPDQRAFAVTAAGLLAVNCVLAGALVLVLDGGWSGLRDGAGTLLTVGIPMGLTLVATASLVPAVATLAAGTVGLLVVGGRAALRHRRAAASAPPAHSPPRSPSEVGTAAAGHAPDAADGGAPSGVAATRDLRTPLLLLSPYLWLLATALPVFLLPASRDWVRDHVRVAPDFPATATGWGWGVEAARDYTPLAVLAHPGFYIALACLLGVLTYRVAGVWASGTGAGLVPAWLRSLPKASLSILLLAAVATVLIDAGMVSVLADGAATVTGDVYPALAPWVGALGSFLTGSTTTSNALFAAFQADIATALDIPAALLLGAQTAGGNVGNAFAPVVVLVGVTALGGAEEIAPIIRRVLPSVVGLLVWLSVETAVLAQLAA